jgi:ankyrin repeat protein
LAASPPAIDSQSLLCPHLIAFVRKSIEDDPSLTKRHYGGWTLLHHAAACAGATRSTPLHAAARRGQIEIARTLLALGANPNARDTKRATPLDRAISCRKKEVAGLLRQPPSAFN